MSSLVERLRADAHGVSRATKAIADAKSARNAEAGEPDAHYLGLELKQTIPWQAAARIEKLEAAIRGTASEGTYNELAIRKAVSFALAELIVEARTALAEKEGV